jgi:hypothetical protein
MARRATNKNSNGNIQRAIIVSASSFAARAIRPW